MARSLATDRKDRRHTGAQTFAGRSYVKLRHTARVTALAGFVQGRTPPDEIQLWRVGENATDYGVHVWSERSIDLVLGRYEARGNPLVIDVEHVGTKLENGEPAPTAGYAHLAVKNGAPWLRFEWSEYGADQISTGQRRALSPEYEIDKVTGEILALYRVSLVADPGTHRARLLASASTGEPMELTVVLAAIRAALAAEDPAVVKESLTNLLAELEKSGGEPTTEPEFAAGEPPRPAPPEEEKKMPMAASAPDPKPQPAPDPNPPPQPTPGPTPAPSPSPAPPEPKPASVTHAADAAVQQIKCAQRDHLLATQGDRLDPSIRRWASAQPLEIVQGLLGATPAKTEETSRVAATRGATQGREQMRGLPKEEAEELERRMGIRRVSAGVRHEGNRLVLSAMSAPEARGAFAAPADGGVFAAKQKTPPARGGR
jgi:hypothetical protein